MIESFGVVLGLGGLGMSPFSYMLVEWAVFCSLWSTMRLGGMWQVREVARSSFGSGKQCLDAMALFYSLHSRLSVDSFHMFAIDGQQESADFKQFHTTHTHIQLLLVDFRTLRVVIWAFGFLYAIP